MSTIETAQDEPITYENLLRLIKHQTVEFEQRLAREAAEREAARKEREAEFEQRLAREAAEREAARKERETEFEQRLAKEAAEREAARKERETKAEAEREKRTAEWKAEHKRMRSEISGIGKSNGAYAEQFFIRAMKRTQTLNGITFNLIEANYNIHGHGVDEEYDIVLHNGEYIAIIEIKYKFEKEDLTTFIYRKVPNFRKVYPDYADKKIILGIAGFSFESEVAEKARAMGIAVLHKDGKNVEFDDTNLKTF